MDWIRFWRMSTALARRGHEVDAISDWDHPPGPAAPRLRTVPFRRVDWIRYDAIKTFFHLGFESLAETGGADHPFILSKLGSVVAHEQTAGVHFFGAVRERLFQLQLAIAQRSRFVTVLTEASGELWRREHGPSPPLLRVPTGVDAVIPPAGPNPYPGVGVHGPVALFAGNLYPRTAQPEVNELWQERLNGVGRALRRRGVRLVAMGSGEVDRLDATAVLHVGEVDLHAFWNWQRHADVGLVLAQGPVQDNESSKIYYYLRTALPVVCEHPVPNAELITRTGHGTLVDYGDVTAFADAAAALARRPPAADGIADYMVAHHSWDARAAVYDPVFARARGIAGPLLAAAPTTGE
jgi:glycosyltransferase involved in cell wall biosynthesis